MIITNVTSYRRLAKATPHSEWSADIQYRVQTFCSTNHEGLCSSTRHGPLLHASRDNKDNDDDENENIDRDSNHNDNNNDNNDDNHNDDNENNNNNNTDDDDDDDDDGSSSSNNSNKNNNNNNTQRHKSRFVQSFAANCLQQVRSSSQGAVVCKTRKRHQALITCNMSCTTW